MDMYEFVHDAMKKETKMDLPSDARGIPKRKTSKNEQQSSAM